MSVGEGTRERSTEPVAPQETQAAPLAGVSFAAQAPFGLNVSTLVSLQKTAGNAAVSALIGAHDRGGADDPGRGMRERPEAPHRRGQCDRWAARSGAESAGANR